MRGFRAAIARGGDLRRPAGRLVRLAGFVLLISHPLSAQSVTPPIAEYQERARSSFRLTNGTLYPLNVVLDVRGFQVTDHGDVVDAPLDTTRLHLKLSAMSFRIPPHGAYTVFYEAAADSLPAWFNIVSGMTGARSDNGLNVRILLPHVVYLNQKQRLQPGDVVVRALEVDSAAHRLRVQLENLGPRLGRVLEMSASNGREHTAPGGGYPLFPHRVRWVEAPWDASGRPSRITVRTARFTLDTIVTAVAATR
jgi:hypothetical protein